MQFEFRDERVIISRDDRRPVDVYEHMQVRSLKIHISTWELLERFLRRYHLSPRTLFAMIFREYRHRNPRIMIQNIKRYARAVSLLLREHLEHFTTTDPALKRVFAWFMCRAYGHYYVYYFRFEVECPETPTKSPPVKPARHKRYVGYYAFRYFDVLDEEDALAIAEDVLQRIYDECELVNVELVDVYEKRCEPYTPL